MTKFEDELNRLEMELEDMATTMVFSQVFQNYRLQYRSVECVTQKTRSSLVTNLPVCTPLVCFCPVCLSLAGWLAGWLLSLPPCLPACLPACLPFNIVIPENLLWQVMMEEVHRDLQGKEDALNEVHKMRAGVFPPPSLCGYIHVCA